MLKTLIVGFCGLVGGAGLARAQSTEAVLHSLGVGSDGSQPIAGLILDKSGALYGTTSVGGASGQGAVFKLSPPAKGQTQWTETVLHSFAPLGGGDGARPESGLIFDKSGALYGTTSGGGPTGGGTVFKLTPPAKGQTQWTETVLYSFNDRSAGSIPHAGLSLDASGALYGTTEFGGAAASGDGTVFKLTPPAKGETQWTETVLHSFTGGNDGRQPFAGVILDKNGALYGATPSAPSGGPGGTVFKLSPPAKGQPQWTKTLLHTFNGREDGAQPYADLTFDKNGALYGATMEGGATGGGVVFKLTPPADGQTEWTETVLHHFSVKGGFGPRAKLIFDKSGALYGTTSLGGASGQGTVFKLTPPAQGQTQWTETVLHSFGSGNDEAQPVAGLILGADGALYGTTIGGGASGPGSVLGGGGTVFELK